MAQVMHSFHPEKPGLLQCNDESFSSTSPIGLQSCNNDRRRRTTMMAFIRRAEFLATCAVFVFVAAIVVGAF
jgi:hypothetical protein